MSGPANGWVYFGAVVAALVVSAVAGVIARRGDRR
jgi:hypothetical protein